MALSERLANSGRPDRLAEVRVRVQDQLVESLGPRLYDATVSDRDLTDLVQRRVRELLEHEDSTLSIKDKARIMQQIGDIVLGLGPLEAFIRDPEVTEIMVNDGQNIYVERGGKLYATGVHFTDENQLRRTIDKIVAKVGRRVDESSPYVDARLPDGT